MLCVVASYAGGGWRPAVGTQQLWLARVYQLRRASVGDARMSALLALFHCRFSTCFGCPIASIFQSITGEATAFGLEARSEPAQGVPDFFFRGSSGNVLLVGEGKVCTTVSVKPPLALAGPQAALSQLYLRACAVCLTVVVHSLLLTCSTHLRATACVGVGFLVPIIFQTLLFVDAQGAQCQCVTLRGRQLP
jgi:hypothetical protein